MTNEKCIEIIRSIVIFFCSPAGTNFVQYGNTMKHIKQHCKYCSMLLK